MDRVETAKCIRVFPQIGQAAMRFGGMFRGMLQGMFRRYAPQIHKQHLICSQVCFEGMIRGYDSTYVSTCFG